MFNENSIINEVNVINKVICFLLVIACLFICNEPIFLLFVDIFLLLITKQYSSLFKINVLNTFFLVLSIFFSQFLWITKILTLIIYTILLKKITKAVKLRYVLESTLYRFQSKKITYHILYIIYFIKYYKNHLKHLFILKDDYGMKFNFEFIKFIIIKSYQKTKLVLDNLMEINKFRFYNYSKERTYIEKPTWESWDTNYLISHIIIFLLTVFYGR